MKKTLLLLMVLLLLPMAFAVPDLSSLNTTLMAGYTFDDADTTGGNPDDVVSTHDGTSMNTPTTGGTVDCIINECYDFNSGSTEYISLPSFDPGSAFTVSGWWKPDNTGATSILFSRYGGAGAKSIQIFFTSGGNLYARFYDSDSPTSDYIGRLKNGALDTSLQHIVITYDGGTSTSGINITVDNVQVDDTDTTSGSYGGWQQNPAKGFEINSQSNGGATFDGDTDEVYIWGRVLSVDEIGYLYNNSYGLQYPWNNATGGGSPPAGNITLTVKATDEVHNRGITGGFSANITNGANTISRHNTTDQVKFNIEPNLLWNVSVGNFSYFNTGEQNYNASASITRTYDTFNSWLLINATRLFLGTDITTFNGTNNQTANQTTSTTLRLKAHNGTNNVQIDVPGNYSQNYTFSVSLFNTSGRIASGIYDAKYTFNASNNITGLEISPITVNAANVTISATASGSGTDVTLNLIQGYVYDFIHNKTGYENKTVRLESNASQQYYTFNVRPAPSLDLTIRDAITSALVTENITVSITGATSGVVNYTTTGGLFQANLEPGANVVKLTSANYSTATYNIIVLDGIVVTLTAFLFVSDGDVTFTFVDDDSSAAIEGVSFSMQQFINSTWQTIASRTSDITGRTQVDYADETEYKFFATKNGYESKNWTLDPIIFTSYTVQLSRSTTLNNEESYQGVSIQHTPKLFYSTQANNLEVIYVSPSSTLTSYGFNVSYPGGGYAAGDNNAIGGTLNYSFTPSAAVFGDTVNLSIFYTTTLGGTKTYNYRYNIQTAAPNGTFLGVQDATFGMGLLERVLISTLIILIMAGLVTLFGGALIGGATALIMQGFFVYTGFLPIWSVIISLIVGFILIAGRSE